MGTSDHLIETDIDILTVSAKFAGRERIIGAVGSRGTKQMLESLCSIPDEFEAKKKRSSRR